MSDYLPDVISSGGSPPVISKRAAAAQRHAALDVYYHSLKAVVRSQKDQIDTEALGDALGFATEEELEFLDWALDRAGSSMAKLEIVASKAAIFARKNNSRIERRF